MDHFSDEHENGTFQIMRHTFQFQFPSVVKRHLKFTIRDIDCALLDGLAARGDVNRSAPSV